MKARLLYSSGAVLTIFFLSLFLAPPTGLKSALSDRGGIVATGDLTLPRSSHTATLLPDGKVLIAAGMHRNGSVQATAEIYDPATGQSKPAGKFLSPRGYGSTATLLPSGKVLIAGGSCGPGCVLSTAELYDPSTGAFRATGNMSGPRAAARAVRLQNSDVLLVGGDSGPDGPSLASAELYHAATEKFSRTGSMHTPRDYFNAVLLKDGRVLVMGGSSTGQHAGMIEEASAEIYDPATGRFTPTGSMTTPRNKLGAALLPDGRVLVVGGQNRGTFGAMLATSEIYDPASGKFTRGPDMGAKRYKLLDGAIALGNGRVLVAGGAEQPEIFDPAANSFLPAAGAKLDAFYFSATTLLANGDVLISGGYGANMGAGAIPHAWIYHPN
jgi:WD40 repeat protein